VKLKKRKLNEPPAAKAPPPAKKAAITPAASFSKVTVKKEIKPVSLPVKDSRSDSSFFSAPKPKPKLPSFKKAPANVKQEPDTNVAQPSSIDPFQEALKSMGKGRKASPAVSTPPPIAAASTPPAGNTTGKTKRKSVSWAPEGQLESIRLIERAVYDDDPVDVSPLLYFHVYCTLISRVLHSSDRVYILRTVFAILIGEKGRRCMHIYSKNSSTGRIQ
jgi:protein phosphatase 1 regulatory subunit 10